MSSCCLICLVGLGSQNITQIPSFNFPGSFNSTLLNDQLWSTFILTKIIELPKWKYENLLKSTLSGNHPGNWFDLCEDCSENVVHIVEIQDEINVLQFKVNKLVDQVQNKFKCSLEKENELIKGNSGPGHSHGFGNDVSEEIRQFFKITSQQLCQTKVEVNISTEITQETDDDGNWEASNDLDPENDNRSSGSEEWTKPFSKQLTKKKRFRKGFKETSDKCQRSYYTPGTFHCIICPRKLKSQALLDKHYSYHYYTNGKFNGKLDCTICKAPFARFFHLKNHYKNVHKLELPNKEDNGGGLNIKMEVDVDRETGGDDDGNGEDSVNIFNDDQVEVDHDNDSFERKRALNQLSIAAYKFHQCTICPRKLTSEALLDKHYSYHDYTKRKYNGKFDCTICKAPCARLFHLRNHYQNVHKLELPKNWDVPKDSEMEIDLGTQMDDDGEEETPNNLDDNQVEKPSRTKRTIKRTFKNHDYETTTFQCTMCTNKYRNQVSLNKHLDYHQMTKRKYNGKFDCDKCGTPFARILHLTNHYRNVHQCTLGLDKINNGDLGDGKHVSFSPDQNNFKCPETECQFSCKKEGGLKYHLKVKHKLNDLPVSMTSSPPVCDLCGFTTKEGDYAKQQMQRHLLNHKIFDNSVNPSVSTTELVCNLCNQLFKNRTDLRSHMVTIHASDLGLTSHQCSYCPRLFPNKQNLFHHEQRIHKKKGRFPCPHCDHEAMNPYRLKEHMATHTTDRVICQYCSATYTKAGGRLREHIKKHHPDKYVPSTSRLNFSGVPVKNNGLNEKKPKLRQFKCKYCCGGDNGDGVVFESQLAYTMHLEESHKDLYKFKCDLCGDDEKKAYLSLTSLNYHKKIHHEDKGKGARCGWCGAKVAHKFYLYSHRKHCKSRPEGVKGILAVEDESDNDN